MWRICLKKDDSPAKQKAVNDTVNKKRKDLSTKKNLSGMMKCSEIFFDAEKDNLINPYNDEGDYLTEQDLKF